MLCQSKNMLLIDISSILVGVYIAVAYILDIKNLYCHSKWIFSESSYSTLFSCICCCYRKVCCNNNLHQDHSYIHWWSSYKTEQSHKVEIARSSVHTQRTKQTSNKKYDLHRALTHDQKSLPQWSHITTENDKLHNSQ